MTLPTPLLARARRRLATMVWLLALVVVAKGTLFSLCIGEGAASGEARAEPQSVPALADATAVLVSDDGGNPCWHAGRDGCHCTCVHGSALPVIASIWGAVPASTARLVLPPPSPHHILLPPALRPPIA